MTSPSGSNPNGRSWCYKDTIYADTVRSLVSMGDNTDYSKFAICPKKNCNVQLFNRYYLYRHIEERHPEDQKHTYSVIKQASSRTTNENDHIMEDDQGENAMEIDSNEPAPNSQNNDSSSEDDDDDSSCSSDSSGEESDEENGPIPEEYQDYDRAVSFVDKYRNDPFLTGMIQVMSKYKFEKGVASSTVNSLASELLQLHYHTQPANDNLKAYQKIAESDHLQDAFIEKGNKCFVAPVSRDTIVDVHGRVHQLKYTILPIKCILEKAFKNKSLVDHLYKEQKNLRHLQSSTIRSHHDAGIFARMSGKIKLEVYVDDTQYSPGFFNSKQKYTCIYISLADLPFQHRSRSDAIEVYLLVNQKQLAELRIKDPMVALFNILRREIEEINQVGGFSLCTSTGERFQSPVTISTLLGDNLAIYPLLGFSGCFNNKSFICRFCSARGNSVDGGDDTQDLFTRRKLIDGTKVTDVAEVGVRTDFSFDGFDGINRWNIAPPDLMHDLAEGVVPAILSLILSYIVNKQKLNPSAGRAWKSANRKIIEKRVKSFIFYEGKLLLKWTKGKGKKGDKKKDGQYKVVGSAVQRLELLLKLEAVLIDILNPSWPVFELYKLLRQFVLLSFAPSFSRDDTKTFEKLANRIMLNCKIINADFSITCKLHQLTHYGDITELFGPLFLYSTFRYERKHQFGKVVTRFSKNFVNPAVTIHSKHQKRRALWLEASQYEQRNFFDEDQTSQPIVLSRLPLSCTLLPAAKHPFSTKKNILRKLSTRRDLYLEITAFHQDSSNGQVYCSGTLWQKKLNVIDGRGKIFARRNETLFELEKVYQVEKHFKLEDLHYSNDYIFVHNTSVYLLEWIS